MKISEAITMLDRQKVNTFDTEEKLGWINELEWRIKREIIDTHEQGELYPFDGYAGEESLEQQLLAPAPWDMVYVRWMEAMIDYRNGESERYENSRILSTRPMRILRRGITGPTSL